MTLKYIDSHAHLFLEEFDSDRDKVIEQAIISGVDKMLIPNIDGSSIETLIKLCKRYPQYCFPAIGLHPTSVEENWEEEIIRLEKWFSKEKFYAIGEIGMDMYWDKSKISWQEKVFRKMLNWAMHYKLPVSIHSRDAVHEVMDIIDEENDGSLKGVFHCFGGSVEEAKKIVCKGFKLGIGGVVTFKNSGLDKLIKEINLEDILLETDAPYLAPVPHRGKRNESAYIPEIAMKIAEIKKCNIEQVAIMTTKNASELFSL